MTNPVSEPTVADEAPWSNITEYDKQHDEAYLRLLDADSEGMAKDEMALRILGIDPDNEPERARRRWKATWRLLTGCPKSAIATWPPDVIPAPNAIRTTLSNGSIF